MSSPALRLDGLGGYFGVETGGPRPVIDRGRARISEEALNRLLTRLSVSLRLGAGQAELETDVGGFRIAATLTAAAAPTGRLRLEATSLRLMGWLPVPAHLVSLALSRLVGQRGVYVVGQRSVDLDLPELLNSLPIALDLRVSHVQVEPRWLEMHCVPRM